MKLKDFCGILDMVSTVVIWTEDSLIEEEPAFEGAWMDVPWWLMDYKIGRPAGDDEEPVYISLKEENEYGVRLPVMVINVIKEDD